jgi:pectate lyase
MTRRQIVAGTIAAALLLTGLTAWAKFDRSEQVLAVASRVLASGSAQLVRVGGTRMAVVTVDSTASLIAAMNVAQGGDTILLAPGTYSNLGFKAPPAYASAVTITSADPANMAVITDFTLVRMSNLTFSRVELATLDHPDKISPGGSNYWAFKISKSNEIHFSQVKFHGSLDGNAGNDVQGLQVRDSTNVSVTNSEFQQLERALAIGQTDNVNVIGNSAFNLRSDGFNFAEVGNINVSGNTFRNFTPTSVDHPDAIQFWTSGTKTPSHDILISGNVIMKGDGAYTQGIFLRDQIGTLPYERLTISDNLIVGTGYNGIRIQGVKDLTLTGNELVSFKGDNKTFLLVQGGDGVVATGNRAAQISFDKSVNVSQNGNMITDAVSDSGVAALRAWLLDNPDAGAHVSQLLPVDFDMPAVIGFEPLQVSTQSYSMFGPLETGYGLF